MACIRACAVVGPTKLNPRRLSSLAIALDSVVTATMSPMPAGRARGDNFRVFSQPDLGLFSDGLETGDLSRGGHTRP